MAVLLPLGAMAQVDDLYFVPTKKKEKKENKVTVSNKQVIKSDANTTQNGTNVVRLKKSTTGNLVKEMDEDAYNRRPGTRVKYTEEYEEEYDTILIKGDESGEYTYSTRLVRFHSPRHSAILSSPLYWNVVYESGVDNWTIYDDGTYWDIYPSYSYSTTYYTPSYADYGWQMGYNWYTGYDWYVNHVWYSNFYGWHHTPWGWHYNSWHWSINPWFWRHPYEWYSFAWGYHPNHGLSAHGHGGHHSHTGGYRNAGYTGRNGNSGHRGGNYAPRTSGPSRADAGVRAGATPNRDRNTPTQISNRRGNSSERVYNRPSSTRNNTSRTNVSGERGGNDANRTIVNSNRQQRNSSSIVRPTRSNSSKKQPRSYER